jgi:hypothetical protein
MIFIILSPQTLYVATSALITLPLLEPFGVLSFATAPMLGTTTAPESCRLAVIVSAEHSVDRRQALEVSRRKPSLVRSCSHAGLRYEIGGRGS